MTTIGPSLVITGEITCQEDITIHGRVKGHVRMQGGALLVAPKGTVEADIHGSRVTIHGTVTGDVAAQHVELTPTAEVNGTITAPTVVLQEGAKFNGLIDMAKKGAAAKTPASVTPISKAS
jgi:cytoskeletal protein CcmA (bactofilin family)